MAHFVPIDRCSDAVTQSLLRAVADAKETDWGGSLTVQRRIAVPKGAFDSCPKIAFVIDKFVKPHRMYIQRLAPHTFYNWHKDDQRTAALVMALNITPDSYTLFGEDPVDTFISSLEKLDYEANTMYVMNAARLHGGVNLTNDFRYLVNLSISAPFHMPAVLKSLSEKFGV